MVAVTDLAVMAPLAVPTVTASEVVEVAADLFPLWHPQLMRCWLVAGVRIRWLRHCGPWAVLSVREGQ